MDQIARASRLAVIGLVAVAAALPALAFWAAMSNYHSGMAAHRASDLSNRLDEARYQVGAEESLERKYRIEPGPQARAAFLHAADAMQTALAGVIELSGPDERAAFEQVLELQKRYVHATLRMFAAVDAGDTRLTEKIDRDEGDPAFDRIAQQVFAATTRYKAVADAEVRGLVQLQTTILVATPLVLALALMLVVFFSIVLHASQAEARNAIAREAIAARDNERRFRALVQSAKDVILICEASARIVYQAPTAETAWGHGLGELTGHSLLDLVHPEDRAIASGFWQRVASSGGGTGQAELRLQWENDAWRHVELTLVDLLQEPSIAGIVATVADIDERKGFERQLIQQAFYDPLTGLPNRALFRDRLSQAILRRRRRHHHVGLLFLDLDNFKLVNDSLGHEVGDRLLTEAAIRLQACAGSNDTVARLGGDEFVVILGYIVDDTDALPVAERIIQQFNRPFDLDGREVVVTASIGIALNLDEDADAETLLRNADVAMYRAKVAGKGQYRVFDPIMHRDTLARLELESDLRCALARDEFVVFYQPIVQMDSGRVTEFEALVRWRHPAKGLVPPGDFIPVAEETGLIIPLGNWVLRAACRQAVTWQAANPLEPPVRVSVNLSAKQFQSPDLVAEISGALADTGLPANCLKIEITESSLMANVEAAIMTLWQVKALGIQVALDDFGTGYSSLAYLKRLPLDALKIDQSFIKGINYDAEDAAIVRSIISLARPLGISVTAEGIENAGQLDVLRAWHCNSGQGFYFGKAADPASVDLLGRTARADRNAAGTPVQPAEAEECTLLAND